MGIVMMFILVSSLVGVLVFTVVGFCVSCLLERHNNRRKQKRNMVKKQYDWDLSKM